MSFLNYTGLDNRNNYTGYTWDVTLELYFAQARFYAPEEHRFTQEDPVKDGGNWYGYVGNNPLMWVDLLGLLASGDQISGGGNNSPSDVRELQKALKAQGYYDGAIDGSFGPQTQAAVKDFKLDHNLNRYVANVDGATWKALGLKASSPNVSTNSTSAYSDRTNVAATQRLLSQLGIYSGSIDGSFGPQTDAAVRAFQASHGLAADGSVGPKTWDALNQAISEKKWKDSTITSLDKHKKQMAEIGSQNNTPMLDGEFEQLQCLPTYVGAVYVNSDGLIVVGHSAVMLVRDDGQAELYSYNGNPDDIGGIIGFGALGLFSDMATLASWIPDLYVGTRPYLSVPIDENGNETTFDFLNFTGVQNTDSMISDVLIEDKYHRGLYIPISDEQGQAMRQEARRIRENVLSGNDPGYNVTGNNCTMIAMDILGAGGIYSRGENLGHPYTLMFIPNIQYEQMAAGNLYDNWGNERYEFGSKVEGVIPIYWPNGHNK